MLELHPPEPHISGPAFDLGIRGLMASTASATANAATSSVKFQHSMAVVVSGVMRGSAPQPSTSTDVGMGNCRQAARFPHFREVAGLKPAGKQVENSSLDTGDNIP